MPLRKTWRYCISLFQNRFWVDSASFPSKIKPAASGIARNVIYTKEGTLQLFRFPACIFHLFVLFPLCGDETHVFGPCRLKGLGVVMMQVGEERVRVPGSHTWAEPGNPTATI